MLNTHHSVVVFVVFALCSAVVNLLEALLKLLGLARQPSEEACVEVRHILWRYKCFDWMAASRKHFLSVHKRWATPAEVLGSHELAFYDADLSHATLIRLSGPVKDVCNPDRSPFAYQRMLGEAVEVVKVSHVALAAHAAGLGPLQPRLSLVSTSGRSGGSLLMRDMAGLATRNSLLLAECPTSTTFDRLLCQLSAEDAAPLLRNVLLTLLNGRGYDHVVIKTYPLSPRYADVLHLAFPGEVRWLMNRRRDTYGKLCSYFRFAGSTCHIGIGVAVSRVFEGVNLLLLHWFGVPLQTIHHMVRRQIYFCDEVVEAATETIQPRFEDTAAMLIAHVEVELRRIQADPSKPVPLTVDFEEIVGPATAKSLLLAVQEHCGFQVSEARVDEVLRGRSRHSQTACEFYTALAAKFRPAVFDGPSRRRIDRLFHQLSLPAVQWPKH